MNQEIKAIHDDLREYQKSARAFGMHWRHWLSTLIIDHWISQGKTQKELAEAMGVSEPFVSRLVHSGSNFQADVFGKVLHAMGIHPSQISVSATAEARKSENTHGQETIETTTPVIARIIPDGSPDGTVRVQRTSGPRYVPIRQHPASQAV